MTKFLKKYIQDLEKVLESNKKNNWKEFLDRNLEMIRFMQHERLIHLLVTLFFGLNFILITMFLWVNPALVLLVADFLLIILLIPYIFHYFKLENGVQKLYQLNQLIRKRV